MNLFRGLRTQSISANKTACYAKEEQRAREGRELIMRRGFQRRRDLGSLQTPTWDLHSWRLAGGTAVGTRVGIGSRSDYDEHIRS